jgi:hypothetical protein
MAIFSCRRQARSGGCLFLAIEMTASEFGMFFAQIVVPSSGSSAISTSGPVAAADLFADIEHRRFIALAFADHHGSIGSLDG